MTAADVLGSSPLVFVLLTVVIFGGFGFLMGQALAITWRPAWQMIPYAALLAGTNRFFSFALFEGELLSVPGFVLDFLVVAALALFAYRASRAAKMVSQYPWLYERGGLFTWRQRQEGS
jgi:hypothetical protein